MVAVAVGVGVAVVVGVGVGVAVGVVVVVVVVVAGEMKDFSWSYSAYSSAVRCLRLFRYVYIDKLVPEGNEAGDLVFGSSLHSGINAALTGQDGEAVFALYWDSYQTKNLDYGRYKWAELKILGLGFMRKFKAKDYELQFAEQRLYATYKDVKCEGTLDFYGKFKGRLALMDFKTSARNYEPEKADCATQLYLYAYLAIQNGMQTPEILGYQVFQKGGGSIQAPLVWEFSETKMLLALDQLVEYTKTWAGTSYPQNWNSCLDYGKKCAYYGVCHPKTEEK